MNAGDALNDELNETIQAHIQYRLNIKNQRSVEFVLGQDDGTSKKVEHPKKKLIQFHSSHARTVEIDIQNTDLDNLKDT